MRPTDLWKADTVFVETGLRDGALGSALDAAGLKNYLGLSCVPERIERVKAACPQIADRLTHAPWRHTVAQNNARVLLLSGFTALYVWRYRAVRHAEFVACRLGFSPTSLLAVIGWMVYFAFRRYTVPKLVTCIAPDGTRRHLLVAKVKKVRPRKGARHFIPHRLGVTGLFQQFATHKLPYAVLRWFETLPHVEPGEDLDVLVDDDALEQVLAIMNAQPGIQPSDVYTPSGLPKSDYRNTPYYPPEMARRLLRNAITSNGVCRVPAPIEHFHSLAYHAVYHKGKQSGVPSRNGVVQSLKNPDHDYPAILADMARKLGANVEITLEGLHEYLGKVGWAPQPDMLTRLAANAAKNKWLQHLAGQLHPEAQDAGLAVFCIRQKVVELGYADRILEKLEQGGWRILKTKHLTPDEISYTSKRTRGGNWGKGFWKTSSGPPSVIVVAYDHHPIKPTRAQLKKYPQVTNARLFIKEPIRAMVNAEIPPEEECNALHSTDYGGEAWYFIDVYMPEQLEAIRSMVNQACPAEAIETRRAA
jgi:hypothetical protein